MARAQYEQLIAFSELKQTSVPKLNIMTLIDGVNQQVTTNVLQQFGLSTYAAIYQKTTGQAEYQNGGGINTIYNVRNGVFADSDKTMASRVQAETNGYNQKIANKYRGQSNTYKTINDDLGIQKKAGKLIDPNTGQKLARNELTDLDHRIALETIYEDPARVLANLSVDELANNKDNLTLTGRSINRSMGAKNKNDYADNLAENKVKWQNDIERLKNNPNLTDQEKKNKIKNIEQRLKADEKAIRTSQQAAQKAYDKRINSYYTSQEFMLATLKQASLKAGSDALRTISGLLLMQLKEVFFGSLIKTIKQWNTFNSMKERFNFFKVEVKTAFAEFKQTLSDYQKILDTLATTTTSAVVGVATMLVNLLINAFVTTGKNFARLLADTTQAVMSAIVLLMKPSELTFSQKIKEALKLVTTAVVASVGFVISETFKTYLLTTPFAPLASIIANTLSAVLSGVVTGILIYIIDNFGEILNEIKAIAHTMTYAFVSEASIREEYLQTIQKIDGIYNKLLTAIADEYDQLGKLAELAYDLGLPTAIQLKNSVTLANHVGLKSTELLINKTQVLKFLQE